MNNRRRDETTAADRAATPASKSGRDTAAFSASPTEVVPNVDPPKPVAPPAAAGQTCDFLPQPEANAKLDQTMDIPASTPADPGGTIDAAPAAAQGDVTGEFSPTNPLSPATQGTVDFGSPAAGAGRPIRTVDVSVFDSEGSAGAGNWPAVAGYQILGELGRGGMGVVYKARQRGLHRLVALKMILAGAHASELQLARFNIEAEAVARLQHPNIVQIHEVGQHDGLPYFSLEFVDGGPLDKKITGKPQPPREAAQMIETLARAMHFAHKQGIIHRDLKPANILMTADGVPKITDFGLAKRLEEADSSQTKSGTIMGTPNYMSPEQARGEVRMVGPLADLYTLGAILYELLTGRPPFQGSNVMNTVLQVTNTEPIPPSRLQPKTPRDLETICLKCLQKIPGKRYADCFELAEDLRRYLVGEPILARPISNVERLWRWCQRNPTLAGAAATILLLLFVVSVGSTWAAIAIHAEKELAERNEKLANEQKALAQENEQKAKTSEKTAQQQADLALNTLSLLINKVQAQLGNQPGVRQLRHDLLQTAMDGLKQVTGAAAGKMHRNTSDAYFQMGGIALEFGKSEDAYKYWQQFYDMAQSALKDNPNNERSKLELAWSSEFLGDMSVRRGDPKKALVYYHKALELRTELAAVPYAERMRRNAKLPPEDRITPRVSLLRVSEAYGRIGYVHAIVQRDFALSEEPVLKSLALREQLLAQDASGQAVWFMTANPAAWPTVLSVVASVPSRVNQLNAMRVDLSRTYHLIGEISLRLRNLQQSRLYYQKCEEIREAILRDDEKEVERLMQLGTPRPPSFRLMDDVGSFHRYYGDMLLLLGEPLPEVLAHVDRAIALGRRVLALDKAVDFRQHLAEALYSRGMVAVRAGDPAMATKCFAECLEIREQIAAQDAGNYSKKKDLLEVLARAGKHERAAALAEDLRRGHEKDAGFLIGAARCYARCSMAVAGKPALRQKYVDLALAALETALGLGYKDITTLEAHPDLDSVREMPAFKKLLEKVRR
jgi:tetratricopeptide (TPR) repeat protein/tRNA A-37 threonylcarbamoyl transferase component Bud32